MSYKTLVDISNINKNISDRGIYFLDKENEYEFIPYSEVYNKALHRLGKLQSLGLKPKDKLIFQLDKNKEFVFMFWACILGNIVPVPITVASNSEQRTKLLNVFSITDRSHIVTSQKKQTGLLKDMGKYTDEETITAMKEKIILLEDFEEDYNLGEVHDVKEEDIAFIQFSSGSTGMPKGVTLTHKNLITNLTDIVESSQINEKDATLSWLPLTHDLGIIGFHLTPSFLGINQTIISSTLFIHKPMTWINAVSKLKATLLSSPNFGYKYFLSHYKEVERDWDLSRVKLIYNGAEPIDVDLAEEFIEKLQKYKLGSNVMYTVYGMAEASLGVTFPIPNAKVEYLSVSRKRLCIGEPIEIIDENNIDSVKYANNGYHLRNCNVRITDEDGAELPEMYVGNIEIKGDNVTKVYYNNPEYTEKTISKDGWLSTGDLGFFYEKGLYVTGRKKDLIIINGVNYYAHDIERVCSEIDGIESDKVVACSIFDNKTHEEDMIIFINNRCAIEEFAELAKKVKVHLISKIGIEAKYVIPSKAKYKTTSGKVKRYKYVEDYYNGEFDKVISDLDELLKPNNKEIKLKNTSDTVTSELLKIAKEELSIEHIGLEDNLMEFGANSIKIVKIHSRLMNLYPETVSISDLYDYPTISKLADHIINSQKAEIISNKFPKELLNTQTDESIVNISLNEAVVQALNNISTREKIEVKDIILSLYIYLISCISENDEVVVQVVKDNYYADEVKISLSDVEDISHLYRKVQADIGRENNKTYMLKNLIVKDNEDGIIAAFNYGNTDSNLNMNCYDIFLDADLLKEKKELKFTFKNHFTEESAMMFVEKYNNILAQI